jgi:hypothetical protein
MSESSIEANEADVMEQETPVSDDDAEAMGPELSPIGDAQADEGDVLEQRIEVPLDDDYTEAES